MTIENLHPASLRQALRDEFVDAQELSAAITESGNVPVPDAADKILVSVDDDGTPVSAWVAIDDVIPEGGGGGSVSEWGDLTGDISDQTDLQNALDAKVPTDREILATAGLTGGGQLDNDVQIGLSAASQASLAKADTALQPGDAMPADMILWYDDVDGWPDAPSDGLPRIWVQTDPEGDPPPSGGRPGRAPGDLVFIAQTSGE